MSGSEDDPEVPDGAAVFPLIPAELEVNPLLLAVLHAVVFLDGSEEEIVHSEAAVEALEYIAGYLQRLKGPPLARLREDLDCLVDYARQQQWPKAQVQLLQEFLHSYGVGAEGEA